MRTRSFVLETWAGMTSNAGSAANFSCPSYRNCRPRLGSAPTGREEKKDSEGDEKNDFKMEFLIVVTKILTMADTMRRQISIRSIHTEITDNQYQANHNLT